MGQLGGEEGPRAVGEALRAVIAVRKQRGQPALTFGTVYPFSCHAYELRYWMAACGIDPEADVQLVVIPPPLMVDNLRDGYVDGFCVGEPWNSLAVEAGLARIIVSKSELWRRGVEKMLCVPSALAIERPQVLAALIRALDRAARWGDEPANRRELAELLAAPDYLDVPAPIVERALSGELVPARGQPVRFVPDFLVLHRDGANRPPVEQAQMAVQPDAALEPDRGQPGGRAGSCRRFPPGHLRSGVSRRDMAGGAGAGGDLRACLPACRHLLRRPAACEPDGPAARADEAAQDLGMQPN